MGAKLPLSFYERKTEIVAKDLIGKVLVRKLSNGKTLKAIITETEAYLGIKDKACHTFRGKRTARTEAMWGPAGHAYVYFVYGMHHCFNAVTRQQGVPEAILIRGAIPLVSTRQTAVWKKNEPNIKRWNQLMSGPGKLCKVLGINKQLNKRSLNSNQIWIEEGIRVSRKSIIKTSRVGIKYAEEAQYWPLRFIWNFGGLCESLFEHNKNHRKNASCKAAK